MLDAAFEAVTLCWQRWLVSRDIEAFLVRRACRSVLIAFSILAIAWSADASELEICYSRFSPVWKPEFKHALTEELKRLHERLGDAYNDPDLPVIDIPIAEAGSVYLASSCEYAASLQKSLDKSILFYAVSKGEYERVNELVSQDGRFIRRERN